MTTIEAMKSLRGTRCPGCARAKKPDRSVCGACFFALAPELRSRLYRRFGEGYEAAIAEALAVLAAREPESPVRREASLFGGPA